MKLLTRIHIDGMPEHAMLCNSMPLNTAPLTRCPSACASATTFSIEAALGPTPEGTPAVTFAAEAG